MNEYKILKTLLTMKIPHKMLLIKAKIDIIQSKTST